MTETFKREKYFVTQYTIIPRATSSVLELINSRELQRLRELNKPNFDVYFPYSGTLTILSP